jgi:hypothetical protein
MNDYISLFDIKSIKYHPKNSLSIIKEINRFSNNSFENLKYSSTKYSHLDQDSYMLQISNGHSIETFIFSIYGDSSGYYLRDTKIRHFHNKENALKYKLAKSYENYFDDESVEYLCYKLNKVDDVYDTYDYINESYRHGNRIYIL